MLKISRQTDYGLLATVFLARKAGEVASAHQIATFYALPVPMVAKVLKLLHEGGIVQSHRGVGGGYSFEGSPEGMTLGKIVEVLEGPWDLVECESIDSEGHAVCSIRTDCPTRPVMSGINQTVKNAFEQVTLGDLVRGAFPLTGAGRKPAAVVTSTEEFQ